MKNLLLIGVCLIAIAGCDVSRSTGGKGVNANNANLVLTPSPKASPAADKADVKEKTAVPSAVALLKKSAGKYPYEIKLFENPELKERLKKMLGADFAVFKANWDVETPIDIEKDILMASGCEKHNCGDNHYLMFVDLEKDNINIYHIKKGTQTYAERGTIELPGKFAEALESNY